MSVDLGQPTRQDVPHRKTLRNTRKQESRHMQQIDAMRSEDQALYTGGGSPYLGGQTKTHHDKPNDREQRLGKTRISWPAAAKGSMKWPAVGAPEKMKQTRERRRRI